MPATITLGHVLLLVAALDLAVGLVMLTAAARRQPALGRDTPEHARAGATRRAGGIVMAAAVILAVMALTPLGDMVLMGEGA